ncbi:MAG: OadG family protein [Syntrophomonadaceae bacterium]|nr:OadG family protein [Syntrophomonadaceae bacterium]
MGGGERLGTDWDLVFTVVVRGFGSVFSVLLLLMLSISVTSKIIKRLERTEF